MFERKVGELRGDRGEVLEHGDARPTRHEGGRGGLKNREDFHRMRRSKGSFPFFVPR